MSISHEAWAAELHYLQADDDGKTVSELAAMANVSARTMSRIVSRGIAAGRYRRGWARRMVADGRRLRLPVYSIIEGKESP